MVDRVSKFKTVVGVPVLLFLGLFRQSLGGRGLAIGVAGCWFAGGS
jgi:hypothetical protein